MRVALHAHAVLFHFREAGAVIELHALFFEIVDDVPAVCRAGVVHNELIHLDHRNGFAVLVGEEIRRFRADHAAAHHRDVLRTVEQGGILQHVHRKEHVLAVDALDFRLDLPRARGG